MSASEAQTGIVLKYYRQIGVASIRLTAPLKRGALIGFRGHVTDFDQSVDSMQIQHQAVTVAHPGDIVGIKTDHYVRKNDRIFIIFETGKKGTK